MRNLSAFLCLFIAFGSFSQDEATFRPTDISFDIEKLKTLDFGTDSLNGNELLFRFFPAPMSENDAESEWKTAAFWSCPSCTRREMIMFEDIEEAEKETLPFDVNYTSCTNIVYYQSEKGTLRAIVSFSTSRTNDGAGRFTMGLLSLANFEKQNGTWKLLNFEPFVNYQGMFTQASPVDEVMINKSGKIYFLIHGGQANGVYAEEYWPIYQGLYVIDGEKLMEVLHLPVASCVENGASVGSNWKTDIRDIENMNEKLVITFMTYGRIVKQYNWSEPRFFQYVAESDFDKLPESFFFNGTQKVIISNTESTFERPLIFMKYTDSKNLDNDNLLIPVQNKRVK